MNLKLDDLRFLSAIEASGSLAGAARATGVTPPAITQRLHQIELRLGLHLIDRSHHRVRLTGEGILLVSDGRRILDDVDKLSESLHSCRNTIAGNLRVFAPLGFGRRYIAPSAERFHRQYPEVTLELKLGDRVEQLPTETNDLTIYIGQIRDSARKFRRLAPNQRLVCAAPDYLLRRGVPTHPDELREHDCIVLSENDEDASLWRFLRLADNLPVNVRVKARLSANDGEVIRRWAVSGQGVIVRSEWDVVDDIRTGRLSVILEEWRVPSADVIVFLGPKGERPARIQKFLQYMIDDLTPPPWRTSI